MMFEWKGRLGSAKQKLIRFVRFFDGSREEHPNTTLSAPISAVVHQEPVNSIANYSLEAVSEKAQALMYQRVWARPK